MARRKTTTGKPGRPPKNAVAKKRGPGRPRKAHGTEAAVGFGFAGFPEMTQAQKDMDNRHAAVRIALEANRGGVPMSASRVVSEAQVFFDYIGNGVSEPKAAEPTPIPETGPTSFALSLGGTTLPPSEGDARDEYPREAAE